MTSKQMPLRSPRHLARAFAVIGIYQWLIGGGDAASIDAHLPEVLSDIAGEEPLELGGEDFAHCDRTLFAELLHGAIDGAGSIEAAFEPFVDRPVKALSPVERAILMIGTLELKNHPEVPYRVVINEAVELTKTFGGTDGFRYVNGVLDKVAGALRADEVARRKAK